MEKIIKGLGIAALHLSSLAQTGAIYSALQADADCCIEAITMLKDQDAAYQGAVELLRQKTILFDDAIKRLKEQEHDGLKHYYDGSIEP